MEKSEEEIPTTIIFGGGYVFVIPKPYDYSHLHMIMEGDAPSYETRELCEFANRFRKSSIVLNSDMFSFERGITDLSFLTNLKNLYSVFISGVDGDLDYEQLRYVPNTIQELRIDYHKKLSLKFINNLTNIKKLYLDSCKKDFEKIETIENLEHITVRSLGFKNLEPVLKVAPNIESLDLKLGGIKDLSLLPSLKNLKYLELWSVRGLEDISPISQCYNLQNIFLQSLTRTSQIPDLSKLDKLRRLTLWDLPAIKDIEPIYSALSLEDLTIRALKLEPEDFIPLQNLPNLKALTFALGKRKDKAVEDLFDLPPVNEYDFSYV